jgi:DNA-binding response OmpR family regulator
MPDMDGFEVCRRLKESTVTRDIPVIFLSAATATADKLKAFKLGAADYITKPFHHEEVLARVRVHLTLSAAQEQLTRQIRQLQLTDEQLARDIAEHRGIQEDLEAALKRLQTLNVRITAGQEEERHKIAYELHEQLGQEIVSLKMHLGLLKEQDRGKEAQERLLVAQDIAKAMLERIRNMS